MNQELGIDLSAMDTSELGKGDKYLSPNWETMAARQVRVATIRLTECNRKDKTGPANMQNAQAAGIRRCPYFWPAPEKKRDWVTQDTQAFLDNYIPGEEPPMLDLEDTKYIRAWRGYFADVHRMLLILEDQLDVRPVLYCNSTHLNQYATPADWEWLIDYRFVYANYGNQDATFLLNAPLIPQPLTPAHLLAWQFTQRAWGTLYGLTAAKQVALYLWNTSK